MTDVESQLWGSLRSRQLLGFKFRRQATVGPFIVDFLCIEAALIVELDGGQHNEAQDASGTAFLRCKGYDVLRFWNHELVENFNGVLQAIGDALTVRAAHKTLTQPCGRGLKADSAKRLFESAIKPTRGLPGTRCPVILFGICWIGMDSGG